MRQRLVNHRVIDVAAKYLAIGDTLHSDVSGWERQSKSVGVDGYRRMAGDLKEMFSLR